jgi:hypothetical protein|tara:strand:- start:107 stop:376 length:270 start_codon:yes stop_codon:yes gene_type:complete
MGSKHNKKRFLLVKYNINKEGKYDELVELTKKKVGSGKIAEAGIVLDLINETVLKCDIPGVRQDQILSYEKIYNYFYNYYKQSIDQFIK